MLALPNTSVNARERAMSQVRPVAVSPTFVLNGSAFARFRARR
jgi:hypothetical protein